MKNITARVAWHDSEWNGKICQDPMTNTYCRDSSSLLSTRVERRINLDIEEATSNKPFYESADTEYFPPCYWTINAFGNYSHEVKDPHPFQGIKGPLGKLIQPIPPYVANIIPNSIFTWCFKLGFGSGDESYDPRLKENVKRYLGDIEDQDSLVFLYANYSNPINGDDRKYLLLGVSSIVHCEMPAEYKIPEPNLQTIRGMKGMGYFPTLAWQFRLELDPENRILLPYHSFLNWYNNSDDLKKDDNERVIDEISAPVTKSSIIPHFKWVSMHVGYDKSIYLLYELRKSLKKMEKYDSVVDYNELIDSEKKLNSLLKREWKKRGRFPGVYNLLPLYLKKRVTDTHPAIDLLKEYISNTFKSVDAFLASKPEVPSGYPPLVRLSVEAIKDNWDEFQFLSSFDFTEVQFENILDMIGTKGYDEIKENPYLIFEAYNYKSKDDRNGDIDKSDYGINVFQIDIALMPDLEFADWTSDFQPDSPKRLRALIAEILREKAETGDTFATRENILRELRDYPLFYQLDGLDINATTLAKCEPTPLFRERFHIENLEYQRGEVLYQLREYSRLEKIIKDFFVSVRRKKWTLDPEREIMIKEMLSNDKAQIRAGIRENERRQIYQKLLTSGLLVISGKAGSGKTSAIVSLLKESIRKGKTPLFVFTPTGRSNLVIRGRLEEELKTIDGNKVTVSTIHRFLNSALLDRLNSSRENRNTFSGRYREIRQLAMNFRNLLWPFLDGDMSKLEELEKITKDIKFSPRIVVIDESSMINERLMAALFLILNPEGIEHFVLVGDERQLPPIGPGRPFADLIQELKRDDKEENYIRLEANYRFDENRSIGQLASLLEDDSEDPYLMADILSEGDETIQVSYFKNSEELKRIITEIAQPISNGGKSDLSAIFASIIENNGEELRFDRLQILTPKRYGRFASTFINSGIVKNGVAKYEPRTKLICEENQYIDVETDVGSTRLLALANGSVGYITIDGEVYFKELEEIREQYHDDWYIVKQINKIKRNADPYTIETDRYMALGYAITVHKSQGGDYDEVILILSESSRFLTKELFYTAVTRIKGKLHILISSQLSGRLPDFLKKILDNSELNRRKTLLFNQSVDLRRMYPFIMSNGQTIMLRSKIEKIIANSLKEMQIDFEYEPKDFLFQYSIVPDFKLKLNSGIFYLEHLGRMNNPVYRKRWYRKLAKYKEIGIYPELITTSEGEQTEDQDAVISRILGDAKNSKLQNTPEGYSGHHYTL